MNHWQRGMGELASLVHWKPTIREKYQYTGTTPYNGLLRWLRLHISCPKGLLHMSYRYWLLHEWYLPCGPLRCVISSLLAFSRYLSKTISGILTSISNEMSTLGLIVAHWFKAQLSCTSILPTTNSCTIMHTLLQNTYKDYSVSPIYRGWWGPSNGTAI